MYVQMNPLPTICNLARLSTLAALHYFCGGFVLKLANTVFTLLIRGGGGGNFFFFLTDRELL